ncbi:hypothetical protein MKY84_04180 [Chryseomicrobium sp. FSL W7-1435]|uniref:hypothetical protein n=1 Tax=Chryseomicrobium sp. FSL W7-1435 TaxID=2921704 RepID=UPI00315A6BA9
MNAIKIAYLLDPSTEMAGYALRRAREFQNTWPQAVQLFMKQKHPDVDATLYTTQPELYNLLAAYQPNLTIRDAGRSTPEDIRFMHQLGSRVAVIDDSGDGALVADYQLQTLYTEEADYLPMDVRKGLDAYIPISYTPSPPQISKTKRIVILFPEKDPDNLTHRVLRHLTQLHVPLEVDVVIHPSYQHDRFTLQSFILQRKHLQLIETADYLPYLERADLAITSSAHMPYLCVQTATPAVLLAESKREVSYRFGDEIPAFTHLGLGRKVKQSALQNAIMEVVLHEGLLLKKKKQLEALAETLNPAAIIQELKALAELREFTS